MNLRLAQIKKSLKRTSGILVTDIINVRYLTGFTGSAGFVLITSFENIFVTDFRYKEQAENEVSGCKIIIAKGRRPDTVIKLFRKLGVKTLGFEVSVSYEFFSALSHRGFTLRPLKHFIEKYRALKDSREITLIKTAVHRAENAFSEVLPYIKEGSRENKIARMLEDKLKKQGCSKIPFEIIVASGRNSSMPHARPTDKKLNSGDLVVIDWGGEAGGYFSDMTRTLLVKGRNLSEKKKIYDIVLRANKKAITVSVPGITSMDIDRAARDVISKAGYKDFFGHGTGHGVGLQVHESPHISWKMKEKIKQNMVFTIEPGIYVPGVGGVRIEDMVVCRKRPAAITSLNKELQIV